MAHQARKRFGQHFLSDQSVIDEIVGVIAPLSTDRMVEIGPGLSALTAPLLHRLNHLQVVEIDRDLAKRLRNTYPPEKLTVHEIDALEFDFSLCGHPLRIVGNLPYNISTPLLFHLMNVAHLVVDQHFMLQKEVIDRMVAQPGSSAYGRLSVMLQERYKMFSLFDVPPEAFNPPPKVMSSIVRMIPLPNDRPQARSYETFSRMVLEAFSQKRKMLRRSLQAYQIDWDVVGISETARPEELSVTDFIKLSDYCFDRESK
ncbi:16S rRNA (adenine(1518)-N(6)/adenine(1519)-N(6))-dimethyltransferase RsmA [Basilea psittacipulmonis]|uniref:Ribosomal RNA small subunit methyltransferase A n=1 Tax=Basilea psittacipulmonis DSM 24701 TaxID=1072685 RepID=A0A077DFP6_9BURK|nr:16S rRNA (adenine(1518)-N(6)/adenine(1519)-N(6))-dimethyltransferase RsmA [Basilea psittacipulmonis]AIL33006.1 16S rRNA methyltransferase [Basilea psittacipulmonis DSM 24701]